MNGIEREVCNVRAISRSERYGEMNDVRAMVQESEKRSATFGCQSRLAQREMDQANLGNPPNILIPVLFAEAQVFIEAEADIVPIQTVGR